jgi:hypothetical protein
MRTIFDILLFRAFPDLALIGWQEKPAALSPATIAIGDVLDRIIQPIVLMTQPNDPGFHLDLLFLILLSCSRVDRTGVAYQTAAGNYLGHGYSPS